MEIDMAIETARASFFIVKYVLETAIDELLDRAMLRIGKRAKKCAARRQLNGAPSLPDPSIGTDTFAVHKIDFC